MFRPKSKTGLASLVGVVALALAVLPFTAGAQSTSKTYEVTITNLTSNQVFSPPLLATHKPSLHVWQLGQLASDEVRQVAEDGNNAALAAKLKGSVTDVQALAEPLPPGKSVTVKISANDGDVLSAITMLVQTNDGFTGLDNLALSGPVDKEAAAYDAGTEENTEKASDVPGPPFGGKGRPATNPPQPISMHPGITGKADVGSQYAWRGNVARFSVKMTSGDAMMMAPKTGDAMAPASMPKTGDAMMPAKLPVTGGADSAWPFAPYALLGGLALLLAGLGMRGRWRPR